MLSAAIEEAREAVEARILTSLDGIALPVARAMGYAVQGGKGLRGFLVLEGARINKAANNAALSVAAGRGGDADAREPYPARHGCGRGSAAVVCGCRQ